MGRGLLGSITGSQLPTGKSYQGVETSPWAAGMNQGISFGLVAIDELLVAGSELWFVVELYMSHSVCWNAWSKYPCSCQSPTRSFTFSMYVEDARNSTTLFSIPGSQSTMAWAVVGLWSRTTA
jgi:hypothetical protein